MILVIHQSEQSCIYAILPATVEGLRNYLDALHSVQYFKNSPTEKYGHYFKHIAHCAAYYGLWYWMVFLALKFGSNILPRYDTET